MKNFADQLIEAIRTKGNPCVVGLDPRFDLFPQFLKTGSTDDSIRSAIAGFHRIVLDVVSPLVPVVKPQIAFFEQYGIPGLLAFSDTIEYAKEKGLLVIGDVKRNDIASTATAYANAYLGRREVMGRKTPVFDLDAITVSPFLGRDSLTPFVEICNAYGKGLFILVKTSNPGSKDFQDMILRETGKPMYCRVAEMVHELGKDLVGSSGYSSIGAVVGATFPEEAPALRKLMPKSFFLVPGYGAQGGTAQQAMAAVDAKGLGVLVNSSRGITYCYQDAKITESELRDSILRATKKMIEEVTSVIV